MKDATPSRVTIPADLLKKFQTEKGALMMRRLPVAGILMIPEELLAKMGFGDVAKAGFQVLVVPRRNRGRRQSGRRNADWGLPLKPSLVGARDVVGVCAVSHGYPQDVEGARSRALLRWRLTCFMPWLTPQAG